MVSQTRREDGEKRCEPSTAFVGGVCQACEKTRGSRHENGLAALLDAALEIGILDRAGHDEVDRHK